MPARENQPHSNEDEKTPQYALGQDCLTYEWKNNPRWRGVERPYNTEAVLRLRGSVHIEHTLARLGAERLWELLQTEPYVNALGAVTGNQAVQQVQAGLKAIYVSGWQVAADANNAGQMYPDQSLYPADSVPNLCRRINSALQRADQIHHAEGKVATSRSWFAPLVAASPARAHPGHRLRGAYPQDLRRHQLHRIPQSARIQRHQVLHPRRRPRFA